MRCPDRTSRRKEAKRFDAEHDRAGNTNKPERLRYTRNLRIADVAQKLQRDVEIFLARPIQRGRFEALPAEPLVQLRQSLAFASGKFDCDEEPHRRVSV